MMIWIWLLAAAAFAATEAVTAGLVCIWFAVGALGAFFAALAKASLTVQLVVILLFFPIFHALGATFGIFPYFFPPKKKQESEWD